MTEPTYKGASLVVVRQALREVDLEQSLLDALSPEDRERYSRTLATDWVPVDFVDRVYATAAPLLFPGASSVRQLGREIARQHLNGIYRFVLRLVTVPFVIEQTARLWRMYNSQGRLIVVRSEAHSMQMVLEDYAAYPPAVRESLAGYMAGTLELTGASNVRVTHDDSDPKRWEYRVTWR